MKLLILALLFSLSTKAQTTVDTSKIVATKIIEFNKYLENNVSMAQYKTLTPQQTLQIFLNWIEPKKIDKKK